ncbi:MAG: hypothetical protein DELT_03235 [Desulfovibrio sp.]
MHNAYLGIACEERVVEIFIQDDERVVDRLPVQVKLHRHGLPAVQGNARHGFPGALCLRLPACRKLRIMQFHRHDARLKLHHPFSVRRLYDRCGRIHGNDCDRIARADILRLQGFDLLLQLLMLFNILFFMIEFFAHLLHGLCLLGLVLFL